MNYQVVIIGGGPGGKACALKCADLGLSTAIVEKNYPGGDAINDGYFPLKVLISGEDERLGDRIEKAGSSWEDRLEKKGVHLFKGEARIIAQNSLEVDNGSNRQKLDTEFHVIATGNTPVSPISGVQLDGKGLISYQDAMRESKTGTIKGDRIAIVGGDVEGCEFATFFKSRGKDVTIFEALANIMPLCDQETRDYLQSSFEKQGINVKTGAEIIDCSYKQGDGKVELALSSGTKEVFDRVLLTGASTPSLPAGVENLKLKYKADGFLQVNSHFQAQAKAKAESEDEAEVEIDNIYGIGDVIGGITSANAAILEGKTTAINIAARIDKNVQEKTGDYSAMPYVFFTNPQISAVGLREMDAVNKEIDYRTAKVDFRYNLRAQSLGYDRGFVKVLLNPKENKILGVHLIGDSISELIPIATLAYSKGIAPEEVSSLPLPHPTMAELILEAIDEALNK